MFREDIVPGLITTPKFGSLKNPAVEFTFKLLVELPNKLLNLYPLAMST